ncbi:MAG TPA: hypothetical protein VGM54_21815 [Chthoniobacter sp.]|jgi:SAM-dependent methyltransferase
MSLKQLLPEPIRRRLFWCRVRVLAFAKRIGHSFGLGKVIWKLALPSEVQFWEHYVESRGKSCDAEAEFQFRASAEGELQPWLTKWLNVPAGGEVRILDVGAGPMTWVGKKWGDRRVQVEAIDPLAGAYDQILDRFGVVPPVRTQLGEGEGIVAQFGREVFDMTFARNCLDHAYDAIEAVKNMVDATKSGGVIYLWHNQDEAEKLAYQGLHQWNFRLKDGDLLVWKGSRTLNVNRQLLDRLEVLRCDLEDDMIHAVFRKR